MSEALGLSQLCHKDDRFGDLLIEPKRMCDEEWIALSMNGPVERDWLMIACEVTYAALLVIATIGAYFLALLGCAIKYFDNHWTAPIDPVRIEREWNELEKALIVDGIEQHPSFTDGAQPNLKERNRYADILPNNATRFKHSTDREFYFNANYLLDRRVIACQGPKPNEINEFWEMVWDSKATVIVKLVNQWEQNREKCAAYWPAAAGAARALAGMSVKWVSSEPLSPPTNEPRTVTKVYELTRQGETRQVHGVDLENWPDYGVVPEVVLADTVRAVHRILKAHPGLMIAHCSAGIGRSGTFILTYETYNRYIEKNDRTRDLIFRIASHMRGLETGRNGMVQEVEQYTLSYKASQLLISGR